MAKEFRSSPFKPKEILEAASFGPTPFFLYDEKTIRSRAKKMLAIPAPYGLTVRYALKANSSRALIQLIASEGLGFDASSLNEVKRARLAGIPAEKILLTSQEFPSTEQKADLEALIKSGLKYTATSLGNLDFIAPFAASAGLPISLRIHPGVGTGESVSRNTGDKYSSFGIHLEDIKKAQDLIKKHGVDIERIHMHIGSGGDPKAWEENIDRVLECIEFYFPEVKIANFGGGFRVARMPDEEAADITELGKNLASRLKRFAERTGKKLHAEVEPGTFIIAEGGALVTRVMDIKRTGRDGFTFALVDGGMEVLTRPLLYGSRHPFTLLSPDGELRSDETEVGKDTEAIYQDIVVVGRCCESGDSFTLDARQNISPRKMALPKYGDFLVVGAAGAYASSMSFINYNSHQQVAEYLLRSDGNIQLIRARQTLEQIVENERDID